MTWQEPTQAHGPGFYTFAWDNLTVRLDRLRRHGEHISAEIRIDQAEHYLYGADRLSLTGRESRVKVVKGLHALPGCNGYDWITMLDWAAQAILDKERAGEPFVEVGTMPMRKAVPWLIEPFLPSGHPTILFGEGGIGKSTLADLLGICVTTGWGASLGLKVHTPGPVMLLDWEGSQQDTNDILKEFEAGLKLKTAPKFIYRFCEHPLVDDIEAIQEEVFRLKVALVILDSAVPALGGAREAKENAEPLFQALRSLKTTSLIISHEVKDQLQKKRTPYGDVFFWNRARNIWHLRGDPEQEGNIIELGLWNVKANLLARQRPWGLRLSRDDLNCINAERFDLQKSVILSQHLPTVARIYATLQHGSLSALALASQTEISPATVRKTLYRYKGKRFTLNPDDTWGLLQQEA